MFSILDSWPNELAALFVLIIAFLAGFAAKKLVLLLLKSIGLDKAMEKANIAPSSRIKAFEFIGRLIYFAVFILFLPWIFWRLGVGNVSEPILGATDFFKTHLPDIVASLIVLIVGLFVAKLVRELLAPIFRKLGVDSLLRKIGYVDADDVAISELLATIVYVLILVPVAIAALNMLNIQAVSEPTTKMLEQIIIFLPRIAIAVIIIFIGRFIAKLVFMLVEQVLKSIGLDKSTRTVFAEASLSRIIANIVRVMVLIFFIVEALNTLQLGGLTQMVYTAFVIIFGAFGIAFAIAFGLGGKGLAERILNKLADKKKKK